jgi:hypothetical protein
MKSTLALGLALLAIALPLAVTAQTPSPSTGDLQMERKQRKPVVLPKPSAEQVRADADLAVDEYAGRTPGQVVRDTSPLRPSYRPDLDYDVKNGIQDRNLHRELFKR